MERGTFGLMEQTRTLFALLSIALPPGSANPNDQMTTGMDGILVTLYLYLERSYATRRSQQYMSAVKRAEMCVV